MKTMLLHLLTIAALLLPLAATRAQENDLLRLDPKKATPEEWQKLVDFLDHQSKNSLAKTTGGMSEIRSLIIHGNKIPPQSSTITAASPAPILWATWRTWSGTVWDTGTSSTRLLPPR